jgi:hypothetical protein
MPQSVFNSHHATLQSVEKVMLTIAGLIVHPAEDDAGVTTAEAKGVFEEVGLIQFHLQGRHRVKSEAGIRFIV